MAKKIKNLFKHSTVYAIGSVFQGIAGFILVPIYTRNLAVSDFGKLDLLNTLFLILTSIISLGLPSAYIKVVEQDIDKKAEKNKLASTTFISTLSFSVLILAIFSVFSDNIGTALELKNPMLVNLVLGSTLFFILGNIGFAFLRADEKSKFFTGTIITRSILIVLLHALFLIQFKQGIQGIFQGTLLAHLATFTILLYPIAKRLTFSFSSSHLKKLLGFGLAIIPSSLAMWAMDLIDRYFITFFLDFEQVGIYSLAYKVGLILTLSLVTPVQLAWPTFSFSIAKEKGSKKTFAQVLTYFVAISTFAAITLSAFGEIIIQILGNKNYLPGAILILPITLSYVFLGIHYIVVAGLHIQNRSKWYPILILVPAIINIALNIYLIPYFGILGAAITTLISFFVLALITIIIVRRVYGFQYETKRLVKIGLALAIFIAIHYGVSISLPLVHEFLSIFAFVATLLITGVVTKSEIEVVKKLVSRLSS